MDSVASINNVLRNIALTTPQYSAATPYVSGFLDMQPTHNIHITSSKLNTFNNIGPNNQRNILKNILVTSNFGEVNTYDYIFPEDYTDVSNIGLQIIDFTIQDGQGKELDLNNATVSFSLVFIKI